MTTALLVAALAVAPPPGPAPAVRGAGAPVPHLGGGVPASGPALDVPFLPQGPLLCGGAAAAMVERFHGRRGVYAEDYASLVRPAEGGIRAEDLAAALEERGYRVEVLEGDPAAPRRALEEGLPAVLLLRSGEQAYHYVVLVGWDADAALVHDPVRGPDRRVSGERLASLHAPASWWTLVVRPPADEAEDALEAAAADARGRAEGPPHPSAGEAPSGSREATGSGHPLEGALRALRAERYALAERRGADVLAASDDAGVRSLSRQLIATARFRAGRTASALDAWNEIGEPRVDLLVIDGLHRLRWPAVARRLPLTPRDVLTSRDLALARRRLEATPGVATSAVDYRLLADGTAEVRASVVEGRRWPSALDALASTVDASVDRELSLEVGPLVAGAERWTLAGRWLEAHALARIGVAGPVPPLPGIASVELEWDRQRFASADGADLVEERTRGTVELGVWASPSTRIEGRAGLERWTDARRARAGASVRHVLLEERVGVEVDLDGWAGSDVFGRSRIRMGGRLPRGGREWRAHLTGTLAGDHAPRSLWDGAGLGRVREPLLRGVRLVRDGAIRGPVFGPRLVQGSLEHAFLRRVGPARAGIALFVDGSRSWGPAGGSGWLGSWGVQLEGEAGGRRLEVSLGTGAGDWILSLRLGRVTSLP